MHFIQCESDTLYTCKYVDHIYLIGTTHRVDKNSTFAIIICIHKCSTKSDLKKTKFNTYSAAGPQKGKPKIYTI